MEAPSQLVLDRPAEREAQLRATMDAAIERLAQQLAEGHTEEFKQLMAFYARFWTYSVRNCLLIQLQCPQATRCAGRSLWNRLGYHIERGQKAIWIWAPMLKKQLDPDTQEEVTVVTGFRPAPVFDFSQLAERLEKPLPQFWAPLPEDHSVKLARCMGKIEAGGIAVELTRLPEGVEGTSAGGRIRIDERLDSHNRLLVLLHELTHELWHARDEEDPTRTRQQKEFEAEAVAFVAASVMGLEHPTARDYLLNWKATPEQLQQSLLIIQRMVRKVLTLLEIPFDVPNTAEALVA